MLGEVPSWVAALVGAAAAALVTWGVVRETLRRHGEDIAALKAERARIDDAHVKIARLEGRAERENAP